MKRISLPKFAALLCVAVAALSSTGCSETAPVETSTSTASLELWGDYPNERPACVRGIHVTAYCVGNKKARDRNNDLLASTELNTIVIGIKDETGDVYIPGVELDGKPIYTRAMPGIADYIKFLKDRGVYVIARIVVFHDNGVARRRPDWAIRSSTPIPKAAEKGYRADVWVDRRGSAWADPYNRNVWKYNIHVAKKAAELGFQGIQFDYIRFPTDGPTRQCVYSKPHSAASAIKALEGFLSEASEALKPLGVETSIDVFGLTGSSTDDMGIGQRLRDLVRHVDVISPMMYPSHYARGEYGIPHPNQAPYDTIHRSIRDTIRTVSSTGVEIRPYLQDFSLGGVRYTPKMVREQIQAAHDLGINEWLMWNAACRYSGDAFMPQDDQDGHWTDPAQEQPMETSAEEPDEKE